MIDPANEREAMRDDDHRPPPANGREVPINQALGLVVERAGGLIQNEDGRIRGQRARDTDSLALTSRQESSMLADGRLVSGGQGGNELGERRQGARR